MGNTCDPYAPVVDNRPFDDALVGSTSFGRSVDDGLYFFTLGFRMTSVENTEKLGARELTFRRADDIKMFRFSKKPLGLTFNKEAPVVITAVAPGSTGQARNVKTGMVLARIGDTDVTDMEYDEVFKLIMEGMKPLPGPLHKSELSLTDTPQPHSHTIDKFLE